MLRLLEDQRQQTVPPVLPADMEKEQARQASVLGNVLREDTLLTPLPPLLQMIALRVALGATELVAMWPLRVLEHVLLADFRWLPQPLDPLRTTACFAMLAGTERQEGPTLSVRGPVLPEDMHWLPQQLDPLRTTALRAMLDGMVRLEAQRLFAQASVQVEGMH